MGRDRHHSAEFRAAMMMGKSLGDGNHGFRVRQPQMPRAIHLLPARQALFCPAQQRHGKARRHREFLALPELRREHGDRGTSRRQPIAGFTPHIKKHVAACVRALKTSSGDGFVCSGKNSADGLPEIILERARSNLSLVHPIAHG